MGYNLEQCTDEGDTISHALARTATGTALLLSPEMQEIEREIEYMEQRAENRNPGENKLLGMLALGNAFRFVENLFRTEQIDWLTYARAGRILCDRYEALRKDAYIIDFSKTMNSAFGKETL
jgi:hypothetical protein